MVGSSQPFAPPRPLAPRQVLPVAAAFWAVIAVLFAAETYVKMLDHGHSLPWMVFSYLLVWELWAVATPLIAWLCHRFPLAPFRARAVGVHVLAATALTVAHLAAYVGLMMVLRTFDAMTPRSFWDAYRGVLGSRFHSDLIAYAGTVGALHAATYYLRARQRELDAVRARLDMLRGQLQPHFLFNALHTIGGLVRQQREREAVEMISGLSELLRQAIGTAQVQEVPLQDELDLVDRYLDIELVRFADRLQVDFAVEAGARRVFVPVLVLQPLVENAIRHGIAHHAGPGRIRIAAERAQDSIRLEVFNTGPGLNGHREGVGLRNTEERLRHLYGAGRTRLTLENAEGGVRATLVLPWREARA